MKLEFEGKINPEVIMVPKELDDVDVQDTYVIQFLDNIMRGFYLASDNCPFALVDRGSGYKVEWNSNDYEYTEDIVEAARYSMADACMIADVLSNDEAFLDRCKVISILDAIKTKDVDFNLGKKIVKYAKHDIELISDSEPVNDNVNHPAHYERYSIECIVAMEETQGTEAVINFCICNAFKYLWRHQAKNGFEDIKKANWYLNKAIALSEKRLKEEK